MDLSSAWCCIFTPFFLLLLNSMFIQYRITYTNKSTDKQASKHTRHSQFSKQKESKSLLYLFRLVSCVCDVTVTATAAVDVVCSLKDECTPIDRTTDRQDSVDYLKRWCASEWVSKCVWLLISLLKPIKNFINWIVVFKHDASRNVYSTIIQSEITIPLSSVCKQLYHSIQFNSFECCIERARRVLRAQFFSFDNHFLFAESVMSDKCTMYYCWCCCCSCYFWWNQKCQFIWDDLFRNHCFNDFLLFFFFQFRSQSIRLILVGVRGKKIHNKWNGSMVRLDVWSKISHLSFARPNFLLEMDFN